MQMPPEPDEKSFYPNHAQGHLELLRILFQNSGDAK